MPAERAESLSRPGGVLDANDDLAAGPLQLLTDPDLSINNPDNPAINSGTSFFGQFIDHDLDVGPTSLATRNLLRHLTPTIAGDGDFRMVDLLTIAGVNPDSRA